MFFHPESSFLYWLIHEYLAMTADTQRWEKKNAINKATGSHSCCLEAVWRLSTSCLGAPRGQG